jgi:DNA-binding phage protein
MRALRARIGHAIVRRRGKRTLTPVFATVLKVARALGFRLAARQPD